MRRNYRRKRYEEAKEAIPKVVRKVQMMDADTQQTWTSAGKQTDKKNSRSSPLSSHSMSSGNLSMNMNLQSN